MGRGYALRRLSIFFLSLQGLFVAFLFFFPAFLDFLHLSLGDQFLCRFLFSQRSQLVVRFLVKLLLLEGYLPFELLDPLPLCFPNSEGLFRCPVLVDPSWRLRFYPLPSVLQTLCSPIVGLLSGRPVHRERTFVGIHVVVTVDVPVRVQVGSGAVVERCNPVVV